MLYVWTYSVCIRQPNMFTSPLCSIFVAPLPHHFTHRPKSLKTFQAFSSLFSSSRQFEEGFLNDPLIIGSGVTLVFQLRLLAFLSSPPSSLSLPVF